MISAWRNMVGWIGSNDYIINDEGNCEWIDGSAWVPYQLVYYTTK